MSGHVSVTQPLSELQALDLRLGQCRAQLLQLKQVLAGNPDLAQRQHEVEERQGALRGLERKQRDAETGLADLDAKIAAVNAKLYGGSIHNPKELSSWQAELDQFNRRRAQLEEHALEAMLAVDEVRATLQAAEAEWHRVQDAAGAAHRDAAREFNQTREEYGRLQRQREAVSSQVPEDLLATYERLRSTKGGRALADVAAGACSLCGVSIPTSAVQKARAGIAFCDNCGRILHVPH